MIKKLTLLYKGVFGKLLLTYILFSIIPASLIGWVSFQVSEKLLEAHITQSHSNTLDQIEKNISVLLDQVIAIVNIYNMNNEVEPYLSKHYDNFYDELHDKAIVEKKMLTYSFTFDWLHFQSYLIGDNDFDLFSKS